MVTTVAVLPGVLPWVIEGLSVDAWGIARSLLVQMILPLVVGMVLVRVAEQLLVKVQPWVAATSNIALYVLIIAILIAQRGTAAALVVAQNNFDDSWVLVAITLLNTLGVVLLIAAAKSMSRDNALDFLLPQAADVPGRPDPDQ